MEQERTGTEGGILRDGYILVSRAVSKKLGALRAVMLAEIVEAQEGDRRFDNLSGGRWSEVDPERLADEAGLTFEEYQDAMDFLRSSGVVKVADLDGTKFVSVDDDALSKALSEEGETYGY